MIGCLLCVHPAPRSQPPSSPAPLPRLPPQLVVVTDPALCQQLLSAAMDLPKDPGPYHSFNTLTSPGGRTPNMLGHTASHGYWHLVSKGGAAARASPAPAGRCATQAAAPAASGAPQVRKGVAGAFSPRNIRGQFPHVLRLADQIAGILRGAGPAAVLDLDNLLQREAMDVIGRIGFQTEFGALEAYASGAHGGGPLHVASVFETTKGAWCLPAAFPAVGSPHSSRTRSRPWLQVRRWRSPNGGANRCARGCGA